MKKDNYLIIYDAEWRSSVNNTDLPAKVVGDIKVYLTKNRDIDKRYKESKVLLKTKPGYGYFIAGKAKVI